MKKALDKLVHLAELRRDITIRELAKARKDVELAIQHRAECVQMVENLAVQQEQQQDALREPLIGNAQMRGVLEAFFKTLDADKIRLEDARKKIAEADAKIDEARQIVKEHQAAVKVATKKLEKRIQLRAPILEQLNYEAERREEIASEDFAKVNSGIV